MLSYSTARLQLRRLELELGPHPICLALPLPLLPGLSLNTFIDSSQLQRQSRSKLLQPCPNLLGTREGLAVATHNCLLGFSLVSEDVSEPPYEDKVSLIVERNDLSALKFWLLGEQRAEEMCRQ